MAALLRKPADIPPDEAAGPKALFILGQRYSNTAAKFWASLIDEVTEDYPLCSLVELSAASSIPLDRDLLFPEKSLEKDLEGLWEADFEQVLKDTLAELELVGQPSSVRIRIQRGEEELVARDLPADCVDAEIFPHLIVWPLEWARIEESLWNSPSVRGSFTAEDRARGVLYKVSFTAGSEHLSEELYRRFIAVVPCADSI